MTKLNQQLQEKFNTTLQKCFHFTRNEISALWAICATIIGNASFSLSAVSRNYGRKVGRNFLSKVLKKYYNAQDQLLKTHLDEICLKLKPNQKIFIIIDDTLVKKRGKRIFASFRWFDHSIGRQIQAICLVTLVVVVDNHVVLIMPWLIPTPPKKGKSMSKKKKEQDIKTKGAIKMISKMIQWLEDLKTPSRRIVVEADSWFSSKTMLDFLRKIKVSYRIDGKKNYGVQIPDREAIKKAQIQKRGRKRTHFVKYMPLEEYFGLPEKWSKNTMKATGEIIYSRTATVTLKTGGRVRVYAIKRKGAKNPKFILTNVKKNRPPTALLVYREYTYRWRIEEAHRDLKQQFGLEKCQNRTAKVVAGFIGLIMMCYSIWKLCSWESKQTSGTAYACPSWAEQFHKYQVKYVFEEFS